MLAISLSYDSLNSCMVFYLVFAPWADWGKNYFLHDIAFGKNDICIGRHLFKISIRHKVYIIVEYLLSFFIAFAVGSFLHCCRDLNLHNCTTYIHLLLYYAFYTLDGCEEPITVNFWCARYASSPWRMTKSSTIWSAFGQSFSCQLSLIFLITSPNGSLMSCPYMNLGHRTHHLW